jgi:putative copper resistance protein D
MQDLPGTLLMTVARLLVYAAALSSFGLTLFHAWLVPAGQPAPARARLGASRLARALVALLVLGLPLWLAAQIAQVGNGLEDVANPDLAGTVAFATKFGHVWFLVDAATLAMALTIFFRPQDFRVAALLSALVLVALALQGHAVAVEGWAGVAATLGQVLHLLAAGYWLGTLLALAAWHDFEDAAWRAAVVRFSWAGHAAVAALILSGLAMAATLLGTSPLLWAAGYAILLAAKIAVAVVMTALALYNRYAVVPGLPARPHGSQTFMRIVRVNLALGCAAVVLVSVLGTLDPVTGP